MGKYTLKILLCLPKKNAKFLSVGGSSPDPRAYDDWKCYSPTSSLRQIGDVPPDPTNTSPLYISGCASKSNHVFALLISMPCLESINFYQNKLKIKLFLQNNANFLSRPPERPFSYCRFLVTCLFRDVCCSYFQVLQSNNKKFLS